MNGFNLLAFVNSPLNRSALMRSDAVALATLQASETSRLIRICGEQVLLKDGALATDMEPGDHVFLGLDDQSKAWFATRIAEHEGLVGLRKLFVEGLLPKPEVDLLAQARSLVHWNEKHGFCAACGKATEMQDAGYRRICPSCKTEHFPRTDPVVIMAIQHGDEFLLGRQASWAEGMYSALAGFMEPGETIEQAVRREVMEETSISVGDVNYVASQPWPFPSSIMIGMKGEAKSHDITIDPKELQDARWFHRDELKLMLTGKHPKGFYASRPEAIAHHVLSVASS